MVSEKPKYRYCRSINDLIKSRKREGYIDPPFKDIIVGRAIDKNTNSYSSDNLSGEFGDQAFSFENVIFNRPVLLQEFAIGCKLFFYDCKFPLGITIGKGIEMIDSINFSECKIDSLCFDDYNNLNEIEISKCNIGRLELIASLFHELKFYKINIIESPNIKELIIKTENNLDGVVTINKSGIDRISVNGGLGRLELNSSYITVNELILDSIGEDIKINFMNSQFSSESNESLLLIKQSDLSKCRFYNIEFNKVDTILISDSNLNNTLFVNVKWGNKINEYRERKITIGEINSIPLDLETFRLRQIEIGHNNIIFNNQVHYEEVTQIYKQFKFSFSKTGDKVQERYFHALEMKNFEKSLKWNGKNFFTKLVLRFSYWFSDFGQSISRPLCALLITSWLMFLILGFTGHFDKFELTYLLNTDWKGFKNGLLEYVKLLSPIRKEVDTKDELIALLDLFVRVVSSFMIYNIARASRRFIN